MKPYKKIGDVLIERTHDGARFPADLGNSDYREYLGWVSEGNTPEPYVEPEVPPTALIEQAERETMLPRAVREFMLGYFEAYATPAQLAKNPGYAKVKALDDSIKVLRTKL